jgi:hypothetical protein
MGGTVTVRMLDLFSGLGGASEAMRLAGWDVVTVDVEPRFNCTYTADLLTWECPDHAGFDLVWASPPCTEFSRSFLPWLRGKYPDPNLDLVRSALRIIRQVSPKYWIIENVRGSIRWLKPILGKPRMVGQAVLWGRYPELGRVAVAPHKQKLSSSKRAERSKIPFEISLAVCNAISRASKQDL